MKQIRYIIPLIGVVLGVLSVKAQTEDSLITRDVVVEKEFRPIIQNVGKLNIQPKQVETKVEPYIYAGDLDIHAYDPEEDDVGQVGEEQEIPYTVIFTDYIFTSTEKVMMLDFMVVTDGTIFILPASTNPDPEYVKKYLKDGITKWSEAFDIRFVWDDEKLSKELEGLQESKAPLRDRREVLAYLMSLAM